MERQWEQWEQWERGSCKTGVGLKKSDSGRSTGTQVGNRTPGTQVRMKQMVTTSLSSIVFNCKIKQQHNKPKKAKQQKQNPNHDMLIVP